MSDVTTTVESDEDFRRRLAREMQTTLDVERLNSLNGEELDKVARIMGLSRKHIHVIGKAPPEPEPPAAPGRYRYGG